MYKIKYIIKRLLFKFSYFSTFREFMALYVAKRVLCTNDINKMAEKCNLLQQFELNYRLTDGTALGLHREKSFIKHDDDVDVDVLDATNKQMAQLKKNIRMKIGREVVYKNKVQQIAFYDEDGFIFDVVFWYTDSDKIYSYCERNYERIQDAKYFQKDKMEYIEFHGEKYPMPTPIEEWLEMRYGTDWKTPKTYKGDWKEECFDMKRIY
ncbi:LicD family protein [Sulfurimonas sp.]|uniref:LicD family protein n=1 Tax=Sulfurimonas sp. TaxID=2022749 RepID=UPI0019EDC75A|nr:LicD family protein [Sulfurimonas sp.]MBE0514909.1 LicD family protein [Sulfurimonas sp.]